MRFPSCALVIAILIGTPFIDAQQLSTVPDLSTATQSTSSTTAASTTSAATTSSTTSSSSASVTSSSSASSSGSTTSGSSASSTTGSVFSLSSLPTIAGAGIPTMIVPYTAGAPFMQKSDLPEGTVFIAVGAVLAFLGACVLLWRGLVAWSINRSVKRAALASIRAGNEKTTTNWGGSGAGHNPAKGSMYKSLGSSMSMEALTSAGKPVKSHFKDHDTGRNSPPVSLFFSPTAQARGDAPRPPSDVYANRNSAYLPAGYYASPAAQAAGGARATTIGSNLAPYARTSVADPSPPSSPSLAPSRYGAYNQTSTRDYTRAPSRDGLGQNPPMYSQPSHSSLMVGLGDRRSSEGLGGSRAPSAYLDDLFENHTAMASRDRLS